MIEIILVCQHLCRHPVVQFMQVAPALQFRHPFLIIVITQPLQEHQWQQPVPLWHGSNLRRVHLSNRIEEVMKHIVVQRHAIVFPVLSQHIPQHHQRPVPSTSSDEPVRCPIKRIIIPPQCLEHEQIHIEDFLILFTIARHPHARIHPCPPMPDQHL